MEDMIFTEQDLESDDDFLKLQQGEEEERIEKAGINIQIGALDKSGKSFPLGRIPTQRLSQG